VKCLNILLEGNLFYLFSVNQFKEQAYTNLAPQFVLEDLRLQIADTIFNENYKV